MTLSVPTTAILFSHPFGHTEQWTPKYFAYPLAHAAQQQGWLFAATLEGGDTWGNGASQTDLLDLYTLLNGRQALQRLILVGASMGGLASVNAYLAGSIPNLRGCYLIDAALSLSNMYAQASFTASIDTAYGITRGTISSTMGSTGVTSVPTTANFPTIGTNLLLGNGTANVETVTTTGASSGTAVAVTATTKTHASADQVSDYPTKALGFDPLLASAASYNTKNFRMLSSSADSTVNEAANTTAFQTLITGHATVSSQLEHLVGHLQGGAVQPADFVATVKGWI